MVLGFLSSNLESWLVFPPLQIKTMNPKKKYVCATCKSNFDLFGLYSHMKKVRNQKARFSIQFIPSLKRSFSGTWITNYSGGSKTELGKPNTIRNPNKKLFGFGMVLIWSGRVSHSYSHSYSSNPDHSKSEPSQIRTILFGFWMVGPYRDAPSQIQTPFQNWTPCTIRIPNVFGIQVAPVYSSDR